MIVKKIKNNNSRLEQLKLLTRALVDNKISYKIFTDSNEFKSYFLYKIVSLFQDNLKVCWYINEYMNHIYDYSGVNNEDIFETFRVIVQMNQMDLKKFYYSKYVQNDDVEVIKLFENYLTELNINFSNQDVIGLYKLYKKNIISNDDLNNIKIKLNLISADEVKNIKQTTPIVKTVNKIDCRKIINSEDIQRLNAKIIEYINNRTVCQKCGLYDRKKVILDTNLEKPGSVDIIFIGLNPGNEEAIENRPFIGKSGQHVRNFINYLLENISNFKYVITNAIFCSTSNESEIKSVNNVLNNCRPILTEIIKLFSPAKLIVVFGDKVAKSFGIVDSIKKANGKLYFGNIVPIIHPSAVERAPSNASLLSDGFKSVIKLLSIEKPNEDNIPNEKIADEDNKIEITENMTLFDVKHINNKIIYIFYDIEKQEKKYIVKDVKFPIYIKKGDYKDCDYITDKVDAVVEVNEEQRNKLLYSLRIGLQNYVDHNLS